MQEVPMLSGFMLLLAQIRQHTDSTITAVCILWLPVRTMLNLHYRSVDPVEAGRLLGRSDDLQIDALSGIKSEEFCLTFQRLHNQGCAVNVAGNRLLEKYLDHSIELAPVGPDHPKTRRKIDRPTALKRSVKFCYAEPELLPNRSQASAAGYRLCDQLVSLLDLCLGHARFLRRPTIAPSRAA